MSNFLNMFSYFKKSFARKKARRVTQEYSPIIDTINLGKYGNIEFANWSNPLVSNFTIQEQTVAFFNQFIKPGDLAIDIGANIGDTTVPIAICTGVNGLTIGFDPNPYVFKILVQNSKLNKGKYRIDPHQFAISVSPDEFYYVSSEASFANGGISTTAESKKHGKFVHNKKVQGVNLKSFLEANYMDWVNKLSFIKIDTEGYDKEILKSISDLLQKYKPVVIAESFGKASDADKMEIFDVIVNNGYDIYYFEDFDINLKVEKFKSHFDMIRFRSNINIYATPININS